MKSPQSFISFLRVVKFLCIEKAKERFWWWAIAIIPLSVVLIWIIVGVSLPFNHWGYFFSFLF